MSTIVQWIHLAAAVVGIGGIGFMAFLVIPWAGVLSPDQRELFLRVLERRFRWVTWSAIVLLLASGLYNVKLVWEVPWGTYWTFLTVKILLALGVFAISLCLMLPLRICDRLRVKGQTLLTVAFALAMIVILISAYLRRA